MKTCKLIIKDNVNVKFENLDILVRQKINKALKYMPPYARHTPQFKLKRWDGLIAFATVTGGTYLNLLDRALPYVLEAGYDIEIEDLRPEFKFDFEEIDEYFLSDYTWAPGHIFEGEPIILMEHQVNAVNAYLKKENHNSLISAATSAGKCQPLSSKIKIPGGWTTMGEIKEGDIVSIPDGSAVKVLSVYDPGIKDVYEITFEDGRTAKSCGDHIWKVHSFNWQDENKRGAWRLLSLQEIIKEKQKGLRSLSIPLASMVNDNANVDLPIDPYMMGTVLGDDEKSIPEIYLNCGYEQRLAMIRGLLDTAGYVNKRGCIEFRSTSPQLIKNFAYLVQSVGGYVKHRKKTNKTYVYKSERKACKDSYTVSVYHETPEILVTLPRKLELIQKRTVRKFPKLNIVDIKKVSTEEVRCIMIDHPEHLYMTDNFIVTHNTIITACISRMVEKTTGGRTLTIVPSITLVRQTEADYLNLGLDTGVYFGEEKNYNNQHIITTWQSMVFLSKASKDDPEAHKRLLSILDNLDAVMVDECFHEDTKILTKNGEKKIKDILPGEIIINWSENEQKFKEDVVVKQHVNLTNSRSEKMLELEMDDGSILKVTANHKFLTDRGWVRADELTFYDNIISTNSNV
jgi:hypothetical protein